MMEGGKEGRRGGEAGRVLSSRPSLPTWAGRKAGECHDGLHGGVGEEQEEQPGVLQGAGGLQANPPHLE